MAASKRLGADVAYGGALGVGPLADIARAALGAEDIDSLQTRMMSVDQGVCFVLEAPNRERRFLLHPGAERRATAADLAAIPVGDFAWALLGGYAAPQPPETDIFGAWLEALPRGVRLMFDPTSLVLDIDRARVAIALARADWISANRTEAEALTGHADPAAAAPALSRGREGAVVRDGARGCWLSLDGRDAEPIAGFAVAAVDTTGAGDTHTGAFIAARLAQRDPRVAARFANAAAAISVTRRGPATSPNLAETLAFLAARDDDPIWACEQQALGPEQT